MAKRLSFEEFVKRSNEIHNNEYEYESDLYKNTRNKIWMTHKICGNRFQQSPKNHLSGQGCPICGLKNRSTGYSFEDEAKKRFGYRYSFPNINNEYKTSHSKITVKCNICGKTFTKIACDFLTSAYGGCNCEIVKEKMISYDELCKLYKKHKIVKFEGLKHKLNDKIELLCEIHGKYEKYIRDLFNGNDECQTCVRIKTGKTLALSYGEIKERLSNKFSDLTIIDNNEYENTYSYITFKCNKCGNVFKKKVNQILYYDNKEICPQCNKIMVKNERTKTTEQFKLDVRRMYGDLYTVLGEYTSSDKKVLIQCNNCGREFDIEANSFLQGHGCPYHNLNFSKNENKIYEYIKSIFPDTIQNDRKTLKGYELDIFIPSKRIAIECDGLYWHNELKKDKNYHLWKTEECNKNNVRLIHIFEDEWLNKDNIMKSMLNNILGLTKNKIYARKCVLKGVSTKECTVFLNKNHIQGWCPSQIKIGLYYEDELVSLMTFGKSRHFVGNTNTEYELLRFCNKVNTNVIGGASKLFKFFLKEYKPKSIVSYADRRWSEGNLYNQLGFIHTHNSKPNYHYVIGTVRKNRFNFRKSVLVKKYNCPENMSEREFCLKQKWYRIYDCGTMVFKWFNKI